MELVNLTTGRILAEKVEVADRFGKRLKGLMFRKKMFVDHAMHLTPCRSIHTFFMRFPIDVLYLNDQNVIVGLEEHLGQNKVGKSIRGTRSVIELPAGRIREMDLAIGHVMTVRRQPSAQTQHVMKSPLDDARI